MSNKHDPQRAHKARLAAEKERLAAEEARIDRRRSEMERLIQWRHENLPHAGNLPPVIELSPADAATVATWQDEYAAGKITLATLASRVRELHGLAQV